MVNFRLPSPSRLDGRGWLGREWCSFSSTVTIVAVSVAGIDYHCSVVSGVKGGRGYMSLFWVHAVAAVMALL